MAETEEDFKQAVSMAKTAMEKFQLEREFSDRKRKKTENMLLFWLITLSCQQQKTKSKPECFYSLKINLYQALF